MRTRAGFCYGEDEMCYGSDGLSVSVRKRKRPQIASKQVDENRCCRRRLRIDFSGNCSSEGASVSMMKRKRPQLASERGDEDRCCRRRLRFDSSQDNCLDGASGSGRKRKRQQMASEVDEDRTCRQMRFDFFDDLPEEMIVTILSKLSTTATRPADLLNVRLTCKRLNTLAKEPMVLSHASSLCVAIRAKDWSENSYRFLEQCASSGSREARYMLGMIHFYCLHQRAAGAKLMARAAMQSHAAAVYALSVIQFNGSGGSKNDKDLRAGVVLSARAASLGHLDAVRELGHCLQDGYGVPQNAAEGRRLLVHANALELATSSHPSSSSNEHQHQHQTAACSSASAGTGCPLLSDYGCNVPAPKPHPANQFLIDWFNRPMVTCGAAPSTCSGNGGATGGDLRLCSHSGCGRPETRRHEFRRCSVCGQVNYCSRACQALDWKLRHKGECHPMEHWVENQLGIPGGAVNEALVVAVEAVGGGGVGGGAAIVAAEEPVAVHQ